MGNKKEKEPKKISLKKQVALEVTQTLSAALPHLKEILGEKKFQNRIEKAAKRLSAGVKEKKEKLKPVSKKKLPIEAEADNSNSVTAIKYDSP
jgi:hypothetical protein